MAKEKELKPFQKKALAKGRTPLPDSAPEKPKAPKKTRAQKRKCGLQADGKPVPVRKVWRQEDVKKVIKARQDGMTWEEIHQLFPNRSLEGIKQVFWKRDKHAALKTEEAPRKKVKLTLHKSKQTAPRIENPEENDGDDEQSSGNETDDTL